MSGLEIDRQGDSLCERNPIGQGKAQPGWRQRLLGEAAATVLGGGDTLT
jgi:hypothetical protein